MGSTKSLDFKVTFERFIVRNFSSVGLLIMLFLKGVSLYEEI